MKKTYNIVCIVILYRFVKTIFLFNKHGEKINIHHTKENITNAISLDFANLSAI